jgi:hypothetical protein
MFSVIIYSCVLLQGLDWSALYQCKIKAPFAPEVRHQADTHNFENYPDSDELRTIFAHPFFFCN